MQTLWKTIWNWIKENGGPLAAVFTMLVAITMLFQFGVLNPIHQRFDDQERYINQRFDDQERYINQRFDDQDRHFNQRFDAVDQRFDAVDQRLDDQDKRINQRFDAQDKYMDQRFNAVDQRFDAVERRLERLETDVSELRKLDERISRNEGQIDVIRQQLQIVDIPSPPE